MKFERLALPIGHDRKPFVPAQPNYGRLLNFTEEERCERYTKEQNLHKLYVPPKERLSPTIPLCNPQVTRLAQPKHPRERRQLPQNQLIASTQNDGRVTSGTFTRSVSAKADLLQHVDSSSKTRSHSMGKSMSSSQTKSLPDQSVKCTFSKWHQRRTEALNHLVAPYKGDRPQHTYGGTTIISYTPSALSQAREHCAAIGVSKVEWKNLKPPRRTGSMCPFHSHREGVALRSASAYPPTTRAIIKASESEKVQIIVSQALPPKSNNTMPKPPMKVCTRRFVCDGDNSVSVPWDKDLPAVAAPVVIYATERCA